jgi:hypothetical protein
MATHYEIVCLVFPGGARPISILVESTETVGVLASKIWDRQKRTAGQVDLDLLELYRVDVPGENERVRVQRVQAKAGVIKMEEEEPLDSGEELSTLYPSSPPKKTIHILILIPSEGEFVTIMYRLRGDIRGSHSHFRHPSSCSRDKEQLR